MDWTAGLSAYNKSSPVVSRVSKPKDIMVSHTYKLIYV